MLLVAIRSFQSPPFTELDVVYEHINNDIDTSDWGKHILGLLGEKILYCKYYSTFE